MSFVQILSCNSTLGTCCSDFALASILNTTRKIMDFIQLIVPILLIIWGTVGFIQMISNPEAKNGIKKITNKYLAAVIVFFIPTLVNVVLGIMPETFSVSACWKEAKVIDEVARANNNTYISLDDIDYSPIIIGTDQYEQGSKNVSSSSSSNSSNSSSTTTSTSTGSSTGSAIVQYAKSFVGQKYVWGGTWNGELPYTGTDCSGFVQGVFKHFGISLTRTTYTQWADKGSYTLVNASDVRAGDLVMYDGHVGILTGNGNEIVHAKGSRYGIVIDSDYKKCSSHAILGIMRINGVN